MNEQQREAAELLSTDVGERLLVQKVDSFAFTDCVLKIEGDDVQVFKVSDASDREHEFLEILNLALSGSVRLKPKYANDISIVLSKAFREADLSGQAQLLILYKLIGADTSMKRMTAQGRIRRDIRTQRKYWRALDGSSVFSAITEAFQATVTTPQATLQLVRKLLRDADDHRASESQPLLDAGLCFEALATRIAIRCTQSMEDPTFTFKGLVEATRAELKEDHFRIGTYVEMDCRERDAYGPVNAARAAEHMERKDAYDNLCNLAMRYDDSSTRSIHVLLTDGMESYALEQLTVRDFLDLVEEGATEWAVQAQCGLKHSTAELPVVLCPERFSGLTYGLPVREEDLDRVMSLLKLTRIERCPHDLLGRLDSSGTLFVGANPIIC
uniref:Uncharacterized protein n=1 Tax=Pinguiococcus pyrenoidosus TaxID=172671 RepID=A0A7R9U7R4_9STRA